MYLKDLLIDVPEVLELRGDGQTQIESLSADSRKQTQNGLFFCFRGANFDAHDFAALGARVQTCVARREKETGAEPASEPQVWIGPALRPLLPLYAFERSPPRTP